MLHTITSMHVNRFWQFLADTLLREYAIEGNLFSHLTQLMSLLYLGKCKNCEMLC